MLIDQPMGRVERSGRALCDVGDAQAPQLAQGFGLGLEQVDTVEMHRAAGDFAAVSGIAHCRQTEGRLACSRLADQPQHFAALQGQVDALDQRMPGVFVVTFDVQVADFQQRFGGRHVQHSLRPLDLCSIQSTTKLTLTVINATARAGSNGLMSPKVISTALSRTMLPQSAVGG